MHKDKRNDLYSLPKAFNGELNVGCDQLRTKIRRRMWRELRRSEMYREFWCGNPKQNRTIFRPRLRLKDGIKTDLLTWYGHVQRMAEGRLPKIILKWMPKQKWARGRPKKSWMEGIRKAMNERNLNEGQWEDRKQWRLGVGQRRTTFWNRHTYVRTYIHILKRTLRIIIGGLRVDYLP